MVSLVLLHIQAVGASCECWYLAMEPVSRVLLTQLGLVWGHQLEGISGKVVYIR